MRRDVNDYNDNNDDVKNWLVVVRFDVFKAVIGEISYFCDVMSCNIVYIYKRAGRNYRLHLTCRRGTKRG